MKTSSIRTLFITKEVPYPTTTGVSLRTWQNINIMMKFGQVGVFSASNWEPKNSSLPGVSIWKHCNVAEQRTSWEKFNTRLWWFNQSRHSDADWTYSQTAAEELNTLLTEFKPDLVIIEEVWLYPYLSVVKRHKCQIILDNLNIEASLWEQTHQTVKGLKAKFKANIELNHLKFIEKDFSNQAHQIWVCSQDDASLLRQLYGQVSPTQVIFNGINVFNYDSVRSGECSPPPELPNKSRNILFLGQLSYAPNTVAAELLINQIYPRLKQLYPDSHLLLVGRKPTQFMLEAAKKEPGIIVTGSIPDVKPYLAAASVMVVPLLQGGGTRLKIVEAFAAGCPVISTAKGAEGIKAIDGEHLLIRNEVEEIVQGICQLWSDPNLADKLAHSAYELVQAEYSWEAVGNKVNLAVQELFSGKDS
ncbi:glycosyltransferase [Sphaerospermopsis aphanizomenoides BCCUSP55]|uniref:glycosyltransferase family 4 protein n=1 Tax=Sphaerospermopsis aphanizomenoides TaxID=459663 RepID=UPI001907CEF3|nr:glycosyltransferase family 4 protein [Sphaerospermopsis aphanizomenoides]MBK1989589.1 glycosyltransferase [Sphaerospermopsis aphanizomenoides BCCUSP55]